MWGGLTVYGINLAQKLKWDKRWTPLAAPRFLAMGIAFPLATLYVSAAKE